MPSNKSIFFVYFIVQILALVTVSYGATDLFIEQANSPDYFKRLGVDRNASESEIKYAYRKRVKVLHPDSNPTASEEERQKSQEAYIKINEAYETLGNPELRQEYVNGSSPTSPPSFTSEDEAIYSLTNSAVLWIMNDLVRAALSGRVDRLQEAAAAAVASHASAFPLYYHVLANPFNSAGFDTNTWRILVALAEASRQRKLKFLTQDLRNFNSMRWSIWESFNYFMEKRRLGQIETLVENTNIWSMFRVFLAMLEGQHDIGPYFYGEFNDSESVYGILAYSQLPMAVRANRSPIVSRMVTLLSQDGSAASEELLEELQISLQYIAYNHDELMSFIEDQRTSILAKRPPDNLFNRAWRTLRRYKLHCGYWLEGWNRL